MNIKSAEIADIILISGFFYQKSSMGDDLNAIWLLRNHVLPGLKDKRDWLNFSKGCPIGKTMVELTMAKTCHAIPIDIVDRLDTSQLHISVHDHCVYYCGGLLHIMYPERKWRNPHKWEFFPRKLSLLVYKCYGLVDEYISRQGTHFVPIDPRVPEFWHEDDYFYGRATGILQIRSLKKSKRITFCIKEVVQTQ